MDDSVDKKLAARFKEVFDGYEDGGAAEGWASLQQRNRRKRPVPFYWLSGAAAMLLLAAGLFWLYPNGENAKQKKHEQVVMKKQAQKEPSADRGKAEDHSAAAEKYAPKEAPPDVAEKISREAFSLATKPDKIREETGPEKKEGKNSTFFTALADTHDEQQLSAYRAKNHFDVKPARGEVRSESIIPEVRMGEMFARENPAAKKAFPKTKKSTASDRRAFALSVYAGSQVNYGVENRRNQARPAAGLQAEYSLGKSKRFSVGIAAGYADYQLAYNNGLPEISGGSGSSAAAMSDARVSAYSAKAPDKKRIPSFVSGNSLSSPTLNTYSFISASSVNVDRVTASFSTIEIPLSLSWQALTGKTGVSLSAALNSTLMMREAYTADVSVSNFRGTVTQTRTEQNAQNFTAFTPFSAAQVSVGVTPGGSKSRLTVEPFARFPLQNQGIEQLRYGAAGLNVKFRLNNIQSHKNNVKTL